MPSFEDVTLTVLQSSVPQESRANMKKQSARNYFLPSCCCCGFSSCFLKKVGSWGLCSPHTVRVTQTHGWGVRRIQNEKDPQSCTVIREVGKEGKKEPSHTFLLPQVTQLAHSFTPAFTAPQDRPMEVTAHRQESRTANRNRRVQHEPFHTPSQEAAFIQQQLLMDNTTLCVTNRILLTVWILKKLF